MAEQKELNFSDLQHRYLNEHFAHIDDKFKSLEQLFQLSVTSHEKLTTVEKEANQKALALAESLARHNQEIANEFRGQLKDQADTFLTISTYDGYHNVLINQLENQEKKINELNEFKSEYIGGSVQHTKETDNFKWVVVTAIIVAGLIIAFADYVGSKSNYFEQFSKPILSQPSTTAITK